MAEQQYTAEDIGLLLAALRRGCEVVRTQWTRYVAWFEDRENDKTRRSGGDPIAAIVAAARALGLQAEPLPGTIPPEVAATVVPALNDALEDAKMEANERETNFVQHFGAELGPKCKPVVEAKQSVTALEDLLSALQGQAAPATQTCPYCGGAGRYLDGPMHDPVEHQCDGCQGTGWVVQAAPQVSRWSEVEQAVLDDLIMHAQDFAAESGQEGSRVMARCWATQADALTKLRDGEYRGQAAPVQGLTREVCKLCSRENPLGFHVPDTIWQAAVPAEYRDHVLCILCFDYCATLAGVDWSQHPVQWWPVSGAAFARTEGQTLEAVAARVAPRAAPAHGYNAADPAGCRRAAAIMVGQAAGLCASACGALADADDAPDLRFALLKLVCELNIKAAALRPGGKGDGGDG